MEITQNNVSAIAVNNPAIKLLNTALLIASLFFSFFVGTEYIAFNTDQVGIYGPQMEIVWIFQALLHGESETVYKVAMWITVILVIISFSLVHLFVFNLRRRFKETTAYGSSKLAELNDIKEMDLLDHEDGLYVGGWNNKFLKDRSSSHLLVVAPHGSGKGAGVVIPNLLSWLGGVLIFDIKGENYIKTAGYRRTVLKQKVMKFDPTCTDGSCARFNPLDTIRMGLHEESDTQLIVDMIIDPNGKTDLDHWHMSAKTLLLGVILHILYARTDKTISGILYLLSDSKRHILEVLDSMLKTEHDPQGKRGWIDPETGKPTKTHPNVASIAREMKNKQYEELSGIVSTAMSHLSLYRDPILQKNICKSDFSIADFMDPLKPMSLYMVVPPAHLLRVVPLTRLIINLISTRMMELTRVDIDNDMTEREKVLFMLDEFPALGKLEIFKKKLSFMRGFGIRVIIICQDLDQIHEAYGEKGSIIGQCNVRIAYATNSEATARQLSTFAGETTVLKQTKSFSDTQSDSVSTGLAEIRRPVLFPDEIFRLPKNAMLIFIEGRYPIYGEKIVYFKEPWFLKMSQIKPVIDVEKTPIKSDFASMTDVVEYKKLKDKEDVLKKEEAVKNNIDWMSIRRSLIDHGWAEEINETEIRLLPKTKADLKFMRSILQGDFLKLTNIFPHLATLKAMEKQSPHMGYDNTIDNGSNYEGQAP